MKPNSNSKFEVFGIFAAIVFQLWPVWMSLFLRGNLTAMFQAKPVEAYFSMVVVSLMLVCLFARNLTQKAFLIAAILLNVMNLFKNPMFASGILIQIFVLISVLWGGRKVKHAK